MLNNLPIVVTETGFHQLRSPNLMAEVHEIKESSLDGTCFAVKGTIWKKSKGKLINKGYNIWHVSGRMFSFRESSLDIISRS